MKPNIIFIATYDTKGEESEYVKKQIEKNKVNCITIDVGVGREPLFKPDVTLSDLCSNTEYDSNSIRKMPRGNAVEIVSKLGSNYVMSIFKEGNLDAVIGMGGAGGTQIVTEIMRKIPFGVPKLVLSTLASGNTRWYVEDSDIMMIPSITDVAGLNCIIKTGFDRFAALASKSAEWYHEASKDYYLKLKDKSVFRISQTMYGTTTIGVTKAKVKLEELGYEPIIFHASGAGGRAMEKFIYDGIIDGVLDMTIAEVGAHIVGGLHDAGDKRLNAAVDMKIPFVLVPGAADTIVLPPMKDIQDKFKNGRILNYHNPTMTTMRTNVQENIAIGTFIADKLKNAKSEIKVFIPKGGLSSIDKPNAIFYYPEANEALFETLKEGLKNTKVEVIEDKRHIYDDGFGEDAALLLDDMMKKYYKK